MAVKIEIQYFNGCPDSSEMLCHVRDAIKKIHFDVDFQEILVETPEAAINTKFRGSPTLLINGDDFERMPARENANLSCRIYQNGIPSVDDIVTKLQSYRYR